MVINGSDLGQPMVRTVFGTKRPGGQRLESGDCPRVGLRELGGVQGEFSFRIGSVGESDTSKQVKYVNQRALFCFVWF